MRVVVVKTDRKLRSINEWKERFDVADVAICVREEWVSIVGRVSMRKT